MMKWSSSLTVVLLGVAAVSGEEKKSEPAAKSAAAVERGRKAMQEKTYVPAIITHTAYGNLWKVWGEKTKPEDFEQRLLQRYGLHAAPYPNKGFPMGLREANGAFGKGLAHTCLLCHAGSVCGQSIVGLGNASLDFQTFLDDVLKVQGINFPMPYPAHAHVRGTIEAVAGAQWVYDYRDKDLNFRKPSRKKFARNTVEDVPAWWLLKKKKTMYHNGGISSDCNRTLMSFLLNPFNSAKYIKSCEPEFADMKAWMRSLEAPKYPFAVDAKKAARGKVVFEKTCARCHGTYGPDGEYPNKIVALDVVGTDPTLHSYSTEEEAAYFNDSWFGRETGPDGKRILSHVTKGYQAPPLDGVWATAPYFHNASVPTVYHVLNSKARPKIFTRSYRTEKEHYDPDKVGWKIKVLDKGADESTPGIERRKIYDTTLPGRSNQGHTFGDRLSEEERGALIEYLKTL